MDVLKLFHDYSIPLAPPGAKHSRPGWIQVECPFCVGNPGWHLGYNAQGDYFNCWRCGGKKTSRVLAKLLGVDEHRAREIMREYGGRSRVPLPSTRKPRSKGFRYPSGTEDLLPSHLRYLKSRHFSPSYLQKTWGVEKGTGPAARLDKIDYRLRLLIPIYNPRGKEVSFQARDVTGRQNPKYKACPKHRELEDHTQLLYGCHLNPEGELALVVEGPTDVWRLGPGALAVFGIDYTRSQVRYLARHYERVYILFDQEKQAQKQAQKLWSELMARGVQSKVGNLFREGQDPAELTESETEAIWKQVKKW
jgi:hypothetical protein